MNGKKAAITLIGIILLVSLLVVIAIKVFFATYEPKQIEETAKYTQASEEQFLVEYKS